MFKLKEDPCNFGLIYDFFNENFSEYMYITGLLDGYRLLMEFKSVYKFRLVNSLYLEIDEFVDSIYSLPLAILALYKDYDYKMATKLIINLYVNNFINYYFLKDLYQYNNENYLYYYMQLSSFYNKLYNFIIEIVDPIFLYSFYGACYYKDIEGYKHMVYYASLYVLNYAINNFDKLNYDLISNFDMTCKYLT